MFLTFTIIHQRRNLWKLWSATGPFESTLIRNCSAIKQKASNHINMPFVIPHVLVTHTTAKAKNNSNYKKQKLLQYSVETVWMVIWQRKCRNKKLMHMEKQRLYPSFLTHSLETVLLEELFILLLCCCYVMQQTIIRKDRGEIWVCLKRLLMKRKKTKKKQKKRVVCCDELCM